MKLKDILNTKQRLVENIVEPSEQVIKGVQKELKMKTGIVTTLGLEKVANSGIYYSSDLSKEIRTPVLQQLFETLTLDVSCNPLPNTVGGYAFNISINYKHPNKGSNGIDLGTIFYKENKFTSRFSGKVRTSELPY